MEAAPVQDMNAPREGVEGPLLESDNALRAFPGGRTLVLDRAITFSLGDVQAEQGYAVAFPIRDLNHHTLRLHVSVARDDPSVRRLLELEAALFRCAQSMPDGPRELRSCVQDSKCPAQFPPTLSVGIDLHTQLLLCERTQSGDECGISLRHESGLDRLQRNTRVVQQILVSGMGVTCGGVATLSTWARTVAVVEVPETRRVSLAQAYVHKVQSLRSERLARRRKAEENGQTLAAILGSGTIASILTSVGDGGTVE